MIVTDSDYFRIEKSRTVVLNVVILQEPWTDKRSQVISTLPSRVKTQEDQEGGWQSAYFFQAISEQKSRLPTLQYLQYILQYTYIYSKMQNFQL